jgi:energy-coupling factor transporter transmembrane protein EcfT
MESVLTTLQTMILNCVRRAEILSIAMETRAFGAKNTRTSLRGIEMKGIDKALTITLIGIAVGTCITLFIQ